MRHRLSCVLLGVALSASFASAQPLPDGLRHVPPDAMGFVHVRVGDFLKLPVGSNVLEMISKDRDAAKGLKELQMMIGMTPADIETVTLVMLPLPKGIFNQRGNNPWLDGPTPRRYYEKREMRPFNDMKPAFPPEKFEGKIEIFKEKLPEPKFEPKKVEEKKSSNDRLADGTYFTSAEGMQFHDEFDGPDLFMGPMAFQPIVIVSATKDFDRKAILRKLFLQPRPGFRSGSPFDGGPSVQFLSDRCVAVGMGFQLTRFNDLMARDPQPKTDGLKTALALAAGKHLIASGGQIPAEVRQMMSSPYYGGPDAKVLALVSPLLATRSAAAIDLDKGLAVTLQFDAANSVAASSAYQALKTLRTLGQLGLEMGGAGGEAGGWVLDLQRAAAKALDNAKIERKDNLVQASLQLEISPALMRKFSNEIVVSMRSRADRTQSMNNLKQIALAMHGYHDANKRLPPAGLSNINDPTGKPLLSWRVAILPYIDQQPLFQQFDLTQPWDHPTNKRLISQMPNIYIVPGTENKDGMTHYRVLVGPQTMFEPNQRITLVGVTDGTSNTIMAVEAAEGTVWTRPDDLPFNPNGPLPKFGTSPDGFLAAFGDGTVRFIRAGTPENDIRALITRNGGENVTLP